MNLPPAHRAGTFRPVPRIFAALTRARPVVSPSWSSPPPPPVPSVVPATRLRWPRRAHPPTPARFAGRSCRRGFECGSISVPVDYSTPNGEQTTIAVSRRRASGPDPSARIPGLQLRRTGRPGRGDPARLRRHGSATDPRPLRPRELRPTRHRRLSCHRLRERQGRRPLLRRRPDADHRRRAAGVLRRHPGRRRLHRGMHRQERLVARPGREPQRRPRPRPAARGCSGPTGSTTSGTRTAPSSGRSTRRSSPSAWVAWCSTDRSTSPPTMRETSTTRPPASNGRSERLSAPVREVRRVRLPIRTDIHARPWPRCATGSRTA